MKFGEKLKRLRKQKKLTQSELASSIGISVRMLIKYEHGESYPRSREIYSKLADVLSVSVNSLLTEDESESEAQTIIERTAALFEGGGLNEADKLAFIHQMQELYLKSVKEK